MTSLDAKFTMLLRELIQHEVNVITDSDWFQEKVSEAVEDKQMRDEEIIRERERYG
jgi:hypothetical protein